MNILYIADPNSIHDQKWMNFINRDKDFNCFLLARNHHFRTHFKESKALEVRSVGYISDVSIRRIFTTLVSAWKIKKIIKKNDIDVVHILYAEPSSLWVIFKFFFKVPMLITCRGTDILKTIPSTFEQINLINLFVSKMYGFSFSNADWITCTSQKQADTVKFYFGRTYGVSIVRTGVDLKLLYSDTQNYFPLSNDKKYILFPRYIEPNYNHEFSLEAIKLLPSEIKKQYKMVFVGRDSGDKGYQMALESIMNSITDVDIEFIHKQDQKAIFELYKRASLVVMTPKSDGSPVSAMEAILCGSKLIVGPLEYDKVFLLKGVTKLDCWSESDLRNAIINSIGDSFIPVDEQFKEIMSQSYNMNMVKVIYYSLGRRLQ